MLDSVFVFWFSLLEGRRKKDVALTKKHIGEILAELFWGGIKNSCCLASAKTLFFNGSISITDASVPLS